MSIGFEIPFPDPGPLSLLGNPCGNPLQTWGPVIALADEEAEWLFAPSVPLRWPGDPRGCAHSLSELSEVPSSDPVPIGPLFSLSRKSRAEGGLYTESPPMRIADGSVLPGACSRWLRFLRREEGEKLQPGTRRLGRNALARACAPAGEHCAHIPTSDAPWGPRECS